MMSKISVFFSLLLFSIGIHAQDIEKETVSDSTATAQQELVSDTTVTQQAAVSEDTEMAEQDAVTGDAEETEQDAVAENADAAEEQPAKQEVAQKKQKQPKAKKVKQPKMKALAAVPEYVEKELTEVEVPELKGTTMEQRIGHGLDSILIRRAYETFESYYAKGVNEEMAADSAFLYAYEPWLYVFKRAPYVNATLYKHGLWMWHTLAVEGKTPKVRNFYFKQLMDTYEKRIDNLDAINSLYDEEGSNSRFVTTRGDIICEKAQNFLQYNPDSVVQLAWAAYQDNDHTANYDIPWTKEMEELYQMYKTAIGDLGRSTRGYTLAYFVKTYYYRYKANKADSTYATDFVNDYVLAKDLCDFFLDSAKQYVPSDQELTAEDSIRYQKELSIQKSIVDEYTYPQWYADYYFQMNPEAASPEFLNQFFMTKIEEEKNNPGYLAWVLKTLESIGQTEIDVYDKASDYLAAARPAGGGGGGNYSQDKIFFSQAVKNMKDMDFFTAKELMQQCVDACSDNAQKAKYLYQAATVCYSKGRIADAREYANKAIAQNKNYGDPYLLLADIIYRTAPRSGGKGITKDQLYWNLGIYCCAATDKAQQAMRMDPGCVNKARTKIANYSRNYYPRSEAFFRGAKEGQRVSVDGLSTTLRLR